MSSFSFTGMFQNAITWMKGTNYSNSSSVIFLGLDAAGKTTLLYHATNNFSGSEVETTIPTIGFNVEVLKVNKLAFTCWDVGGCDKIRPLWRHYMQNMSALMFIIDSNDHDRVDAARDELEVFLREMEESKGVPIFFLANKQDLPRAKSPRELILGCKLYKIQDRPWEIIPSSLLRRKDAVPCIKWIESRLARTTNPQKNGIVDYNPAGLITSEYYFQHMYDEDMKSLGRSTEEGQNERQVDDVVSKTPQAPDANVQKQVQEHDDGKFQLIWKDWLERYHRSDESEDQFVDNIRKYQLNSWDHYAHIRIAYVFIHRLGVKEGFTAIDQSIRDYIANNTVQTNGKSFHPTMTRFWSHLIAYWYLYYQYKKRSKDGIISVASSAIDSGKDFEAIDLANVEFGKFLQFVYSHQSQDTNIANSTLFRQYYQNQTIFSPKARQEVMQPDVKPFPDIRELCQSELDRDWMYDANYWMMPNVV